MDLQLRPPGSMSAAPGSIFTFGYGGRRLRGLEVIQRDLDAIIVDIRERPWSREPEWCYAHLTEIFGSSYAHVGWWGNTARDPAAGRFVSWKLGYEQVAELLKQNRPLILMCGCRSGGGCHRSVIAKLLREKGHPVKELPWQRIQR